MDDQAMELRELAALHVDLELLEPGTHALAVALPKPWIAEILAETDGIADRSGAARLELTLQADRTLLVRGELQVVFMVPCARCLEPAEVDVGAETEELCVTFVPAERLRSWPQVGPEVAGSPETDDDIEPLEASELDEIGYHGSKVDLRALIGEQILLAYPMRVLCKRGEACLGLCMRCGANLNEGADPASPPERCPACGARRDGADEDTPDSPWKQALSKVRGDN